MKFQQTDWRDLEISSARLNYIRKLHDRYNISNQDGYCIASRVLHRTITSYVNLKQGEASEIIDYLKEVYAN